MAFVAHACLAVLGLALASQAWAQRIYTCVDASGRRLSSDRPILECIDREQRVLTPSGTLYRKLSPSYTAAERAELDEKARAAAEEKSRQVEARQRSRALLTRYPTQDVLNRERAAALATVDDVIATANQRVSELRAERQQLDREAAQGKAPAGVKSAIEDNERRLKAQERFIVDQREESLRITQRFDEMQQQLNTLWTQQPPTATTR